MSRQKNSTHKGWRFNVPPADGKWGRIKRVRDRSNIGCLLPRIVKKFKAFFVCRHGFGGVVRSIWVLVN